MLLTLDLLLRLRQPFKLYLRSSMLKSCRFLHENFGPVHAELCEENLEVEGELPAALNGAFARNGPNPYFTPTGGYHW